MAPGTNNLHKNATVPRHISVPHGSRAKAMKPIYVTAAALAATLVTLSIACTPLMSQQEAAEALGEAATATRAQALTNNVIEISTDFTIGRGLENAAEELRGALASQVPCSTVTIAGATVTIDFGSLNDTCFWRGKNWGGVAMIELNSDAPYALTVTHTWIDLTNGDITVNGSGTVDWNIETSSRSVAYQLVWTDIFFEGERTDRGTITQQLINPDAGLVDGFVVGGTRRWESDGGSWTLTAHAVEMRLQDPIPQAGEYTLLTAGGDDLSLAFGRVDEDTIAAELNAVGRSWTFHVHRSGRITEA